MFSKNFYKFLLASIFAFLFSTSFALSADVSNYSVPEVSNCVNKQVLFADIDNGSNLETDTFYIYCNAVWEENTQGDNAGEYISSTLTDFYTYLADGTLVDYSIYDPAVGNFAEISLWDMGLFNVIGFESFSFTAPEEPEDFRLAFMGFIDFITPILVIILPIALSLFAISIAIGYIPKVFHMYQDSYSVNPDYEEDFDDYDERMDNIYSSCSDEEKKEYENFSRPADRPF